MTMDKKRILIVDDEPTFTRMMKLVLEQTGRYEVRQENKGVQALAAARDFRPDLILLDVVMPDLDGGDVAAQIEADPMLKGVPIVFLTALVDEKEAQGAAVKRGGYPFLGKLVSDNNLFECIESNLRK
jgi:CheY-like chemotaxis protein